MAWLSILWRLLFFALAFAGATQAASAAPARAVEATCRAYSSTEVEITEAAALAWTCEQGGWQDGHPVAWLRFPAAPLGIDATEFSSRITVFRRIDIASVDAAGAMQVRSYRPEEAESVVDGAVFRLDLPTPLPDSRHWIVRIERPHSVTVQSDARISEPGYRAESSVMAIAVLTLVFGMLITPLLFDINFYIVLRERFVLLHAGMIVAMIAYLLFAGGLISLFWPVPVSVMAVAAPLGWAVGVGLAGFFIGAYLESEKSMPGCAKLVNIVAWWTILVPGLASLQLDMTQPIDNRVYFYGFLPVIPIYSIVILAALFNGSRAARFLAVAWAPIIVASTDRLLRGLGAYGSPDSFDYGMFISLGFEVIVIALGVADRFLAIRRERDLAMDEAREMEERSARDPLTGLYNRRMLEERFGLLRAEGFTAMAVVDLDRFKAVNDEHGHEVGDRVLQATACALEPGDDVLAFRLGGEEFLLLLRGEDAMQRAERRRKGIATRVAGDVSGLDRLVTASMGLIEVPHNAMPTATFEQLYRRADSLLYEAKQTGRNRTVHERMQLFHPRLGEGRRAAA